jgi:hypothetical protein
MKKLIPTVSLIAAVLLMSGYGLTYRHVVL